MSAEFGFVGCTNDVLFLADRWCSGRQNCEFFIPNKDLDRANGKCSPDLRAYMQMSYYCVEGKIIAKLNRGAGGGELILGSITKRVKAFLLSINVNIILI